MYSALPFDSKEYKPKVILEVALTLDKGGLEENKIRGFDCLLYF